MKLKNKYTKVFATSFFLFYSFFSVFAVFHNHTINFPGKDSLVIHQHESNSKAFDPFMDSDSVCQLYQFSALKVLPETSAGSNFALLEIAAKIQINYESHYSANCFSDLSLRAPPTLA